MSEFNAGASVDAPQASYHKTTITPAKIEHIHKKQSNKTNQYTCNGSNSRLTMIFKGDETSPWAGGVPPDGDGSPMARAAPILPRIHP